MQLKKEIEVSMPVFNSCSKNKNTLQLITENLYKQLFLKYDYRQTIIKLREKKITEYTCTMSYV